MVVSRGSGADGFGGRALTGLFQKVSSQAISTQQTAPSKAADIGSAFDKFHQVDSFFSSNKEGVGRTLAKVADNSVPIGSAVPTLSKYLSGSTRLTDLSA